MARNSLPIVALPNHPHTVRNSFTEIVPINFWWSHFFDENIQLNRGIKVPITLCPAKKIFFLDRS